MNECYTLRCRYHFHYIYIRHYMVLVVADLHIYTVIQSFIHRRKQRKVITIVNLLDGLLKRLYNEMQFINININTRYN